MAEAKKNMLTRVPVREQEPKVRATNFEEVCLGYNEEEAVEEAQRCLHCKNAKCIQGCPVNINIPDFIGAVKEVVSYLRGFSPVWRDLESGKTPHLL